MHIYYLENNPYYGNMTGRIELWERKETDMTAYYEHKYNLYVVDKQICWFEKMMESNLVNDSDPFEPLTFTKCNDNYNVNREW